MLRHKYTKKRMKNKYNQKKRTRKRGGAKNSRTQIPDSCKNPASKVMCNRYCNAKGVIDPGCKCCPGSDSANQAIAKQHLPTVVAKKENPVQPAVAISKDIVSSRRGGDFCFKIRRHNSRMTRLLIW